MSEQIAARIDARKASLVFYVLLLLGLACLWSSVVWINQRSEQQGLAEMRRETAALALLFASHTDTTFRTVDLALKDLREVARSSPQKIAETIAPHMELLKGAVVQVGIIDAKGIVTYSAPIEATSPTYAGDREFFVVQQQSKSDQLFVGRPVRGRVSNKWSIHLSRPIFDHGRFAGIVAIAVDPDYFVRFYQEVGLGNGGAARMIRDTGEVMARSSEQEKFIGKVFNPTPYADPGAPLQGSFRRKAQADGVDRLSSYYRLPQYRLTVVIGPSVDERLLPVREHQKQLVWAAAAITALALLISWLLRRGMLHTAAVRLAVEKSEAKFRLLFQSTNEGVVIHQAVCDGDGKLVSYRFIDVNPTYERLTGLERAQVLGKDVRVVLGVDAPPLLDIYADVLTKRFSKQLEYHDGTRERDYILNVFAHESNQFATVLVDITEQKQLQAQRDADHTKLQEQYAEIVRLQHKLMDQVLHDPLTQLYNRRFLDASLPREMARANREGYPVALIVFDLDHFKSVNDTHGHAFGDEVLRAVSTLLTDHSRETDIVCRLGGEEFLMVLPGMSAEQARQRADDIRVALAQTDIMLDNVSIRVTVSAGIAGFPSHGMSTIELFKLADEALYKAKSAGRNRVAIAQSALPPTH